MKIRGAFLGFGLSGLGILQGLGVRDFNVLGHQRGPAVSEGLRVDGAEVVDALCQLFLDLSFKVTGGPRVQRLNPYRSSGPR